MSDAIRIRMYQAGFGDCFLLFLPTSAGTKTMLVDCGSLGGGTPPMKDVVPRMLADVAASGGGGSGSKTHIDVIVATHRHRDHVGEFEQDAWANVEAGEVWMPWTERPDDPHALRIRAAQEALASALHAALPAGAASGMRDLALNALANQKARDRLLKLGEGDPPKLRWIACEGAGPNALQTPVLPGVEFFVLGPLRDEATFKDLEPPPAQNFANRASAAGDTDSAIRGGTGPFAARWRIPRGDPEKEALSHEEINGLRRALPNALLELLALNDKLINSTSVALVLKIGGTHLLLPGDAQWSTWKAALADPARRELLAKTNFYKVGHHASENATPIEFIETILEGRSDCVSMASWVKRANWERIPEEHLVAGLKRVGPFADHATMPPGGPFAADPGGFYVEATIPVA